MQRSPLVFFAHKQHLTVALKDNTADFRKFGLDSVVDMLEAKPEQEQALLTMVSSDFGGLFLLAEDKKT